MNGPLALFPLAELQMLTPPAGHGSAVLTPELILAILIGVIFLFLLRPPQRRGGKRTSRSAPRRPGPRVTKASKTPKARTAGPARRLRSATAKNWILVDGSNVMHWEDNTPHIEPIRRVVRALKAQGLDPGVVFDANAGWKLVGHFLGERELGQLLDLPQDQILVVPKGSPADPWLLTTARDFGARIVTNDRYRDWATDHPEVAEPGFLVHGGLTEGQVWLDGIGTPRPTT
jgi:Zc3h12a-like Ribonuclease NYN domain